MAIKDANNSRDAEKTSGGTIPLMELRRSSDPQRLSDEIVQNQTILSNKCDYHCYYFLKCIRRNYCLIMPFVSMIIYVYDVFSDFYTAILYFMSNNYWYFGLTLTFIFVPHFIIVAHDLNWYVTDHRKGNILPKWKRIVVGILIGLHIAPILRYFYLFQHEIKIRHKRRDQDELDKEDREHNAKKDYDSSFLKLLESYFESAPQLVIQICILLQILETLSPFRACLQVIFIIGSLLSLSLSMVFLQQFKQENLRGENFSILEKILRAFNQLLLVTSRIVAMSLLATVCPYRLVGIIVAHWVLMVFLIFQLGIAVGTKTSILVQLGEYAELAVILIFSFISIKKGNNIRNGIFYYLVVLCENIIMMVWWSSYCDKDQWYFLSGIVIHCVFFSSGILMIIILNGYYEVRKWVELVRDQAEKA